MRDIHLIREKIVALHREILPRNSASGTIQPGEKSPNSAVRKTHYILITENQHGDLYTRLHANMQEKSFRHRAFENFFCAQFGEVRGQMIEFY